MCKPRILILTMVALALEVCWLNALDEPHYEYQVKAAFLYNFAKFIEWPDAAFDDTTSPFIIGVLGEDPFGITLEQAVSGKTIRGRKLVIRRFIRGQLVNAHILFISSSEEKNLGQILENMRGSNILTVGNMERFARGGGAINFVMKGNKVRFEINIAAAERVGLKINSRLLRLAKIVDGKDSAEKD